MTALALLAIATLAVGSLIASRRRAADPCRPQRHGSDSVDDRDLSREAADLALLRGRARCSTP
ncbi:hypothetical protein [Rhodococcus gannanensis]|uniref:Uncharacterized protein n=1 Tax=Rhodococcus gannanensis TaxID=1960308 RepID=A0ABW4P5Y8_9NOCA